MRFLVASLIIFFPLMAVAAETRLPQELMFHGKPIEPYCLASFVWIGEAKPGGDVADLQKCEISGIAHSPATHYKDGTYSSLYHDKDEPAGTPDSSIEYRYIGKMHDGTLALFMASGGGGGSGSFTFFMLIKRSGDKLSILRDITGGDRCSGAVSDMKVKNGDLWYEKALQPPDILEGTMVDTQNDPINKQISIMKDGLEASARSCFGSAHYKNDTLQYITLVGDGADQKGWTENFSYQACFNSVFRHYVAQGKTKLDEKLRHQFTRDFYTTCSKDNKL